MGWSVELQIFRFNFRNFFLGMIEENTEAQHIPVFGYNTLPYFASQNNAKPM